jgi:hypothetical protein
MNIELQNKSQYINTILDDNSNVLTDIYLITNTKTNKKYVGLANTHRLNTGKYRPFGYIRRLNDHLSEAIVNKKKKQCMYLNNSIRKHGKESFIVELIERCLPDDANDLECHYIKTHNTLYPNGYNLSEGGGRGCSLPEHRAMHKSINQYAEAKLKKYKDVKIDSSNLEKYVHEYKSYGEIYYCVIIDNIKSIFVGKYMNKDTLKQQALDFVKKISEQ